MLALNIAFLCMHGFIGTIVMKMTQVYITSPIELINKATTEVARGHFNVELSETMRAAEIRQMAENFNIMTRELSSIKLFRSDFVNNVSHEFKTPLSVIEGYATLLQDAQLDEQTKQVYVTKIIDQTQHLTKLTGNILNLSQLENQEHVLDKKHFALDEQLRQSVLDFEPQWSKKSLDLDIELDPIHYYGNADLLTQVWQNIMSNAIKFSPNGGQLSLSLKESEQFIKIKFTDTGCGMTKEEQHLIFDKFYQCDTSHSTKGNGLGLTIAKRIVELHHGSIRVQSEKNQYTTFIISLPKSKFKNLN